MPTRKLWMKWVDPKNNRVPSTFRRNRQNKVGFRTRLKTEVLRQGFSDKLVFSLVTQHRYGSK